MNVCLKLFVYSLRHHAASSLKEIGQIMKMDYSAFSVLVRRFEKDMRSDQAGRRLAERLAREVMKRRLFKE